MQGKEIQEKLTSLIEEASAIDPSLATRLDEINRWIKDVKPGLLTAKRFVMFFLLQIIRDAEAWLIVKSLPSEEEQQAAFDALPPALKYWYSYLFPKWLKENDPKFYIWRQKLMAGEFSHEDARLLESVANSVKKRGGSVVQRYIADLSMATDIIVSGRQNKPLCLQLTTISEELSQEKSEGWEKTLQLWGIERGIFLSYNPKATDFLDKIVNITLYNSNNLRTGGYLKLSL